MPDNDPLPIVIDCDPGQDDAVAILLACASPEIELRAVTAVAGNVSLAQTETNARAVLELAGRSDIPVHAGCAGPMTGMPITNAGKHGARGIDGWDAPEPETPLAGADAAGFLVECLRAEPAGELTLVAVGPLTNVATAFAGAPDIAARVGGVAIMGGAAGEAEFNLRADPEAARIVLRCGAPIVMFGLDLTRQVRVTRDRLERIGALATPVGDAVTGMLGFYAADGPLHDPCPVAWLARPDLFSGRPAFVTVDAGTGETRGRLAVEIEPSGAANVTWMEHADADGFFDLLIERLGRL